LKIFNPYNFEFHLNEKYLIEASAGTGKTYTIAVIYLRLIIEKKLLPQNILVVTFTVDAAEELKNRIRKFLTQSYKYLKDGYTDIDNTLKEYLEDFIGDESVLNHLKLALFLMDEASIYTIHKFCRKVLSENPIETGSLFSYEIENSDKELIEDIVYHLFRKIFYGEHPKIIDLFFRVYKIEDIEKLINDYLKYVEVKYIDSNQINAEAILEKIEALENNLLNIEKGFSNPHKTVNKFLNKCKELSFDILTYDFKKTELKYFEDLKEIRDDLVDTFKKYINSKILTSLDEALDYLEQKKLQENIITFNDIVKNVYKSLQKGEELADRYKELKVLLIDEFQDTDFLQTEIFNKVFKNRSIFFIGDPKQSIYAFRGADLNAYFGATKDIKQENRFNLTTCFRSTKNLIENINLIFSKKNFFYDDRIKYQSVSYYPENKTKIISNIDKDFEVYLLDCTSKSDLMEYIYKRVNFSLVNEKIQIQNEIRGVRPEDIAIIVPTNSDAEDIRDYLSKKGIKSVLNTTKTVFETWEAFEMIKILEGLEDYKNPTKIKTALITSIFGRSVSEINEDLIRVYAEKFSKYSLLLQRDGILPAFMKIFDDENSKEKILTKINGERVYTNYLHILELIQQEFLNENCTPEKIRKWLIKRRKGEVKGSEAYELRLESDENAVQIITIHRSKGLEFPIVIIPFFDYPKKADKQEKFYNFYYDFKNKSHILDFANSYENQLSEDIKEKARLFYVALTRAKCKCILFDYNRKNYKYIDTFLYDSQINTKVDHDEKKVKLEGLLKDQAFISDFVISTEKMNSNVEEADDVSYKEFLGQIKSSYTISSYTNIVKSSYSESDDTVELAELFELEDDVEHLYDNEVSLPAGAKTGSYIHKILEDISFDWDYEQISKISVDYAKKYGFDEEVSVEASKLIFNLLNKEFNIDDKRFKFALLKSDMCIKEFEFYLRLKKPDIFLKSLQDVLKNKGVDYFVEKLNQITLNENILTFLRGFIDLVFEYKNKIYIVDWKSNFLGDVEEDYSLENILLEMGEHHYYLQMIIYQIAVYKFLEKSGSKYELGDVFYIFLRGFNPDLGRGFYRFSLSGDEIKQLLECF